MCVCVKRKEKKKVFTLDGSVWNQSIEKHFIGKFLMNRAQVNGVFFFSSASGIVSLLSSATFFPFVFTKDKRDKTTKKKYS